MDFRTQNQIQHEIFSFLWYHKKQPVKLEKSMNRIKKRSIAMATLEQAATLAAYQQRSTSGQGRRQVTEQTARDLAEKEAVAFVNEHLDEYENVGEAIQQYISAYVEVFRRENGLLTPVQYDAHVQAVKDANEELRMARDWKTTPNTDDIHVTVRAQMASWTYISTRFIGIIGDEKTYQEQAEKLLKDPETLQYYRQYIKQYGISYRTRIEEALTSPAKAIDQPNPPQKKGWFR
jgi:hypothetical protein